MTAKATDGIKCSGECVPVTRLEGHIRGIRGRVNLVIGFLLATMCLLLGGIGYANKIDSALAEYKEYNAVQRGIDLSEAKDTKNIATRAFEMIKAHFAQQLPEKSREIHDVMKAQINENKYNIKTLQEKAK